MAPPESMTHSHFESTPTPAHSTNAMMLCSTSSMQTEDHHPMNNLASHHDHDQGAPSLSDVMVTDESTNDAIDALAALASGRALSSQPTHDHHHDHPVSSVSANTITPQQTSSDEDSEVMPPPPPRHPTITTTSNSSSTAPSLFSHDTSNYNMCTTDALLSSPMRLGRLRSASNPEGMEKWDSYSRRNDRMHFVLPSSILEEELASTRRVLGESVDGDDGYIGSGGGGLGGIEFSFNLDSQVQSMAESTSSAFLSSSNTALPRRRRGRATTTQQINVLGTSPNSVTNSLNNNNNNKPTKESASSKFPSKLSSTSHKPKSHKSKLVSTSPNTTIDNDDVDESLLEPEELLRRARSRLLEDLSEGQQQQLEGSGGGEKGVLTLPHSLSKYKEVYNKNGRIGIYTPAERAVIITKFNAKRARRVWNKKIRYNCRKNLADRRLRVKGRFVKRNADATTDDATPSDDKEEKKAGSGGSSDEDKNENGSGITRRTAGKKSRPTTPPTSGSPLQTVDENEESHDDDEDMPDVEDDEAAFAPTDDMPYRRARRYTIT
ncbi:predicted protein [Thalassiosira pseudonana CCMP1335]|uniref:CCT domain-containing protein n=1 Tax=Thalassiosira pseudonana TaxID=35128 RepID=B8BW60_THAPS|nr:predicted protein [Thalassiosira pseudonana CCMP1335]EED94463.1 predicted protein [Thalassiosira pseudonana CCMP1335]